ncbi:MAG: c-type cytochrome [Brumimicrobium sp.]|nr:c-type cytochrome [Brumimicrobium sp.]MCO5269554.1 c-type cytochrome [Brumimicrobium sp.]
MFNKVNKVIIALFGMLFFVASYSVRAQDSGQEIFDAKCATCHTPHKDMTGPKLFNVRQKWEAGGAKAGSLHTWVRNWQEAVATDPYAKSVADWSPSTMNKFPELTDEDIDAIFDYVDAQPVPGAGGPAAGGEGAGEVVVTRSTNWVWYILAGVFLIIIFSAGALRRDLEETDGEEKITFGSKAWVFKNRKGLLLGGAVVTLALITWGFLGLYGIGVYEAYQPTQPIAFPHDIHAGLDKIDCKYCHNSADKSRTAGIPTTNVCMNCHKQITGTDAQVAKIQKIYESAGFNPEGGGTYSGETKNIVWNKVHVLPDHVFFSHQQHVTVGGIDCKQCHGDMTKQNETARIVPVEELNKIEGNVQLTKPTLTMGWCIECHDKKEISQGPLEGKGGYYDEIHKRLLENDPKLYEDYLKDDKVTVRELGGWECSKCHY